MTEELQSACAALLNDTVLALESHNAALDAERTASPPTLARLDALNDEDARRKRAGVRVTLNANDFELRRTAVLVEMGLHAAQTSRNHDRHARSFRAIAVRAFDLLRAMQVELDAPAHAAAVRKEAETAAFWADRKAQGY